MAEISLETKLSISHRGRAIEGLLHKLGVRERPRFLREKPHAVLFADGPDPGPCGHQSRRQPPPGDTSLTHHPELAQARQSGGQLL